jgi:hypothetical protein
MPDLVNKALEVDFDGDGIIFDEYELSGDGGAR